MKKLSLLIVMLAGIFVSSMAQRTIEGTVKDQAGEPLIGANVLVKGLSVGDVSDFDGSYTVQVPEGNNILVFSYTGFETQEVTLGSSNQVDVVLVEGITLSEAVVTALGIERDEKSLGYSVQEVDGDKLSLARDQNVASALTGKVAGVQVVSASGASLGGSANIRIRGATALNGGNPLWVVDGTPISDGNFSNSYSGHDYGNLAQDINPDDIESISVLKGPSATALYGQRAAGGVILVTTKKGKARKGIGVTLNSSVTAENVHILPEYQNEYAGGYTKEFIKSIDPVDGKEYNRLNFSADESWGPPIQGQPYRPWWTWYPGTPDYGKVVPLEANPDNVRDFFDTGVTYNNALAMSGGNENTTFRLSYANISQTGVIPNSELNRNNIGINASTELTDKLTLSASINFANTQGKGRPAFGYSPAQGSVLQSFNQWFQRQVDMDQLRNYKNPDGSLRSWNIRSHTNLRPLYWDSPFFTVYENFETDERDRYFGNVTLNYKILDGLSIQASVRRDNYVQRIEERIATGGLAQDRYSERVANSREDNYDFLINYDTEFGDFSFDANAGGGIRKNDFHNNFVRTAGGLNAPNLFNIKASIDRPVTNSFISEKVVRSVYAAANVGYKSMLYLGATLRNDWSSALPTDNNSYLYPSVSGSFVFSELLGGGSFLSYGKIRGSVAQVGSDIGAYQTNFTYGAGVPYGSLASFALPNTLVNEDLKPALTSSYEVGLDVRFFRNRIGFDVTYYDQHAKDQILTLTVPGSSGFNAAIINAGDIQTKGVELAINATPVSTKNLNWDVNFNIAKNTSKVIELADGLNNRRLANWGWGGLSLNAPVGEEWGTFRGRGHKIDEASGKPIITEEGLYVKENNKDLGGLLPDFTGGFRNTIDFMGISLGAFVEFQVGGQFHSVTKMFNSYSGLSPETAGLNDKGNPVRDPVDQGGGVFIEGVLADGTPHSTYADAQDLYEGNLFANNEYWMYDASYVKLREVSLGYNFPKKMYQNLPIQNIGLSLIAKNLWLIHANVDGIDPSEITPGGGNYVFQENGILPGVRSFGVNLKLGF